MQKKNTFFMYVDKKKSRIRETTNLSTDADSSTNIFVSAGGQIYRQRDRQTDIANTRPNWPSGPIR